MSEASGEDEEQMQYHLYSSCSWSEVKVEIQALTQWSGGKRRYAMCKYLFLENERQKSNFMEEHFFEHFFE